MLKFLYALLLCGTVVPVAADIGEPFEATLEFSRSGLGAEISYALASSGKDYVITTETRATGVAALVMPAATRETARFRMLDGQLLPLAYQRDDGTGKGEDDASVDFDWDRGFATGTSDGQTREFPIEAGRSYDTLSVELATRQALAAGVEAPEFEVIEGAELKRYRYTRLGEDTVRVDGSEYRAEVYELDRQSRRVNTYWFVPELDWIMARMEQHAGARHKGTVALRSIH